MVHSFIRKSTCSLVNTNTRTWKCLRVSTVWAHSCTDRVIFLLNLINSTPGKATPSTVAGNYPVNKSLQTSFLRLTQHSVSLLPCVSDAEPTIPTMAPDWNAATKDYRRYQKVSRRKTPYQDLGISGDICHGERMPSDYV